MAVIDVTDDAQYGPELVQRIKMYHLSNCTLIGITNPSCDCPTNLKFEVVQDRHYPGDWRVEAIDYEGEGEGYVAIFSGPDAEARAKEYADFKQKQQNEEG